MDIVEGVLGGVACPGDADLLSTLTLDVDVAVRLGPLFHHALTVVLSCTLRTIAWHPACVSPCGWRCCPV